MPIVAAGSISDFFHDVVEDAIKARKVEATNGATSYLVSLLSEYAHPNNRAEQTMERPLAFLLDEALHTVEPAERFDRLRALGDGVLYSCGFFGDHFNARGVDQKYLFGIGTCAYGSASLMLRTPHHSSAGDEVRNNALDIFGELASKFGSFVAVLADVADCSTAKGAVNSKEVLKLYERWLKTGSERLAETLTSHGFIPTRGAKGVLQ